MKFKHVYYAEPDSYMELSDVISFHSYQSYEKLIAESRSHQKANRPIFLTEWLQRINHNTVYEVYPLLYLANVSNYCWGEWERLKLMNLGLRCGDNGTEVPVTELLPAISRRSS